MHDVMPYFDHKEGYVSMHDDVMPYFDHKEGFGAEQKEKLI